MSVTVTKQPKFKKRASDLEPMQKFERMREEMKDSLIERDEEIDVVITALLCGENPLLVGPPGTAKSFLLDSIMHWMDAPKFQIQFNKHTQPDEVFGPVSVKGLKEDKYRRITTHMLPEAKVAYFDEIFKGSTAILNILLICLNEKKFYNGEGKAIDIPLKFTVAASNEWPSGEELGALFDRFLFRKKVKYIATKQGMAQLVQDIAHSPTLTTTLTDDDLDQAQAQVLVMDFGHAPRNALLQIIEELQKEGIRPSDRRIYKSIKAAKAFAYLNGESEPRVEHLEILQHVLWDNPIEQPEKAAKIICKIANPVGSQINDILIQIQDIVDKNEPLERTPKLQEVQKKLKELPRNNGTEARIKAALNTVADEIEIAYKQIVNRE